MRACQVPDGIRLEYGTPDFLRYEELGLRALGGTLGVNASAILFYLQRCSTYADTAFVLVAGGLGERLGYNGVKIAIPSEITTNTSYIGQYISYILAYQVCCHCLSITVYVLFIKHHLTRFRSRVQGILRGSLSRPDLIIPLVIMTSDDTHAKTEALLLANDYYGTALGQVRVDLGCSR